MRRLILSLAVLLAVPAGAATAYDPCTAGYPDPALSLRQSDDDAQPGEPLWFGGRLARNGCGIDRARIGLFLRDRAGAFRWAATTTTNRSGDYTFTLRRASSYDAMVVFSGTSAHRRAISQVHHVTVVADDPDDRYGSYTSCDNQVQLGRRWQPPAGWDLQLLGVPSRVRTGTTVKATYRVTNRTDRQMKFTTQASDGVRFVLLQDVRTGERPNGVTFSDFRIVRQVVLEPGQSVDLPASFRAAHCYYPRLHLTRTRTVAWLDVTVRDDEMNIEQTVSWYAPPVPVEIVA